MRIMHVIDYGQYDPPYLGPATGYYYYSVLPYVPPLVTTWNALDKTPPDVDDDTEADTGIVDDEPEPEAKPD